MRRVPLEAALAGHGLFVIGQLIASRAANLPDIGPDRPAAAIALVGHVGSSLWPSFSASAEYCDGQPDPLDRWSRRIGAALAARFEARALYPFDGPPFHPFQRWAALARKLHHSPLGILIDPVYGLWHAWRFGLLLPNALVSSMPTTGDDSPCEACSAKPCLNACPVGAPRICRFAYELCIRHLQSADGHACRTNGCLSRSVCPVASSARYLPAHARFHMQAFLAGLGRFRDA